MAFTGSYLKARRGCSIVDPIATPVTWEESAFYIVSDIIFQLWPLYVSRPRYRADQCSERVTLLAMLAAY